MMNTTDVLIVGAGPTGLTAATLLAYYGVDLRIIDKNATLSQKSKALGVQARTLELWDKLGLAEGAVANGQPLTALNLITKGTLLQGGKPFMALGRDGARVSPYPFLLIYEQNKTERMLLDTFERQTGPRGNYHVERSTEVVRFEQKDNGVTVTLRYGDGSEEIVHTRWLIAADGASSFIRKTLGLEFDGSTYADPLFVADVDMQWPLERDKFYVQMPRQGMLTFFPMRGDGYSDNQYRIIGRIPVAWEDKDQLTGEDIQSLLDSHSVIDAKITDTRWVSKYRIHKRMVKQFRVGRIFLAGDAAHIHSPSGGQGMNTGIQDAWNLAWKVALVVRGEADVQLLDSYEPERMPVAKAILSGSDQGFHFIGSPNYWLHLLRSALLPRLTELASRKSVGEKIFRMLSQTWIRYRNSPAVDRNGTKGAVLPGDRAPYAHFDTGVHAGQSIFTLLRGTTHHLLLFAGDVNETTIKRWQTQIGLSLDAYQIATCMHVIDHSQRSLYAAYGVRSSTMILIRPDGHIAWRGLVHDMGKLTDYMDRLYTWRTSLTIDSESIQTDVNEPAILQH